MTDKIDHVEKLERIMEPLADSVLELSDEAILAETAESGIDPREEAERIRLVLRQATRTTADSHGTDHSFRTLQGKVRSKVDR